MAGMDLYALLGVPSDADAAQIRRAYRALALRMHPDRNPEPEANRRFAAIAEAYSVLSDPDSRRAYDRSRTPHAAPRTGAQGPGPDGRESRNGTNRRDHGPTYAWVNVAGARTRSESPGTGTQNGPTGVGGARWDDVEDVMEALFQGRPTDTGGDGAGTRATGRTGDRAVRLRVNFWTAALGGVVDRPGGGVGPARAGTVGGVVIPPATLDGDRLVLEGGEEAVVRVRPDPVWRRGAPNGEGHRPRLDLWAGALVDAERAARGGRVRIGDLGMRRPDEDLMNREVEIPAGLRTGSVVRLEGLGIASGDGLERGDLRVVFSVDEDGVKAG